jgi:hypothetical protein
LSEGGFLIAMGMWSLAEVLIMGFLELMLSVVVLARRGGDAVEQVRQMVSEHGGDFLGRRGLQKEKGGMLRVHSALKVRERGLLLAGLLLAGQNQSLAAMILARSTTRLE